jgi:hypothetical protein
MDAIEPGKQRQVWAIVEYEARPTIRREYFADPDSIPQHLPRATLLVAVLHQRDSGIVPGGSNGC